VSTTSDGKDAEYLVAAQLQDLGHTVLEMNWRTRWCEIDIVSRSASTVYFTEVKYRKSIEQGTGLDYITSRKLKQMTFAAEMWIASHKEEDEYCLQAAQVDLSGNVEIVEIS
jgi:Holliday junction resolvase-like predicted endonuclease